MANSRRAFAVTKPGDLPIAPVAASPSTSNTGFFQSPPKVSNQFHEDAAFRTAFTAYLPGSVQSSIAEDLGQCGDSVLCPEVLRWTADAEAHPPTLHSWDIWGKRRDELITSEGWRRLQAMGIKEGMVAIAYENGYAEYSRVYQFLKYHLWTGSCAYVTCPGAMSDGAARLLSRHIVSHSKGPEPLGRPYQHLVSRDPSKAWTSGQWMTERVGGSDVRNTETIATHSPLLTTSGNSSGKDVDGAPLGPWLVNGFKWFSSATDANMAILLAKTNKGISAFYAPMRRTASRESITGGSPASKLNGITIQRLKAKLGTRALPTAELSLRDTRAFLIGAEGQGVKEISTILNITRVHTAVTACGLLGRGLAISRAFARVRRVQGKLLTDIGPHVRTMAKQHVEYRAHMHITFFVVSLLGISEQDPSPLGTQASFVNVVPTEPAASLLLRALTPVIKALTAKAAIAGLAECMESLGGVGYLDSSSPLDIETNIARLYRDANVLSIWEGTTDVMADDMIRVLKGTKGREVLSALDAWINTRISSWSTHTALRKAVTSGKIWLSWLALASDIQTQKEDQLKHEARDVMERVGWVVCAILLVEDAKKDYDGVATEVARRWVAKGGPASKTNWMEGAKWDRSVVFEKRDDLAERPSKL